MLIISYDIQDDKIRTDFSKRLQKNGAIRLQYSVYEVVHTKRLFDNLSTLIDEYAAKYFTAADSVVVFDVQDYNVKKYGNAIHRDVDIVYL